MGLGSALGLGTIVKSEHLRHAQHITCGLHSFCHIGGQMSWILLEQRAEGTVKRWPPLGKLVSFDTAVDHALRRAWDHPSSKRLGRFGIR